MVWIVVIIDPGTTFVQNNNIKKLREKKKAYLELCASIVVCCILIFTLVAKSIAGPRRSACPSERPPKILHACLELRPSLHSPIRL